MVLSQIISKCKICCYLLPEIHRKPHVPNVTLAVIKSPKNSHIRLTGFNFIYIIFHFARFPAHNGIFTRLKKKTQDKKEMLIVELNFKHYKQTKILFSKFYLFNGWLAQASIFWNYLSKYSIPSSKWNCKQHPQKLQHPLKIGYQHID